MACSTAAKSSMKLIRSHSTPTTLQYLCCTQLRSMLPDCADALRMLPLPPGLRLLLFNQLGWVLSLGKATQTDTDDCADQLTSPVCARTPADSDRDFISSSVSDNPGSYQGKDELHHDSTFCLDDACHHDSTSVMDVCCYLDPALTSDHTSLSNPCCDTHPSHLSVNDPSCFPIPESCSLCPASCLSGRTVILPDSTSDSDSDELFSDVETYQRKRCRWT